MEKKSLKILVMDDEEIVRDVLGQMLGYLGHQIWVCLNEKEAVAKYLKAAFDSKPFDLVILDLIIPGHRNGSEILKDLKKINQNVIAIVSSGYSDKTPEGFSVFLPKPYRREDLKKALEEALEKK